jgi:hypothetical protein
MPRSRSLFPLRYFSMDHRGVGERSDAVLRTAMPGGDEVSGMRCETNFTSSAPRFAGADDGAAMTTSAYVINSAGKLSGV